MQRSGLLGAFFAFASCWLAKDESSLILHPSLSGRCWRVSSEPYRIFTPLLPRRSTNLAKQPFLLFAKWEWPDGCCNEWWATPLAAKTEIGELGRQSNQSDWLRSHEKEATQSLPTTSDRPSACLPSLVDYTATSNAPISSLPDLFGLC